MRPEQADARDRTPTRAACRGGSPRRDAPRDRHSAVEWPAEVLEARVDLRPWRRVAGPESRGDLDAAARLAPVDGPDQMPSVARGPCGHGERLAVGTAITSSIVVAVSSGGTKPTPPPSMRWVPGGPPDSTADSAGSTATRWIAGQGSPQRARSCPGSSRPCPRRCTTASMRPSSCSSSSSPRRQVAVDHVLVVELVGGVAAGLRHDLGGPRAHRRDERRA